MEAFDAFLPLASAFEAAQSHEEVFSPLAVCHKPAQKGVLATFS